MGDQIYSTGVIIRFEDCSDVDVAQGRLRHLRQLITDHYDGVVKLFVNEESRFDQENISFSGALGVRLDQYDSSNYKDTPTGHRNREPHPWELALEALTHINFHVDGVTLVYLKHFRGARPSDIDLTTDDPPESTIITEPITVWVEVPHSQFDKQPERIDTSLKTAAIYRIAEDTYDPCEFGGDDAETTIEAVIDDLLEQALFDHIPDSILGGRHREELLVQFRIPRSVTMRMDNSNKWQESIRKSSQAGNWGAPGVTAQIQPEPALGFKSPKGVYKSYKSL